MIDPNYCRLYIDTHLKRAETQSVLDEEIAVQFPELTVEGPVYKNDGFEPLFGRPYDPVMASPWTAEVDSDRDDENAVEMFQSGISLLIGNLRKRGLIITAACNFEDRIIAETGWNWTSTSPEPPR